MRRKIFIAAFLILAFAVPAQADSGQYSAPAFFKGLDVPLMPGLVEMEEETVLFDKPGGRIAESIAVTETLAAEDINRFYKATLPQLGWRASGAHAYVRGSEYLRIDVQDEGQIRYVRITITPDGG